MRYIRNRMIEFRDRMEPLLKELNLRARTQTNDGGIEVYFVTRNKNVDPLLSHSSVSIFFDDRETTGLKEATWASACLSIEQHEPRPIGNTGWVHRRWWESKYLDFPAGSEAMWQFIEKNFREQPFVTMERHANEIRSEELFDAFVEISRLPDDMRIEGLKLDQQFSEDGRVESIAFDDVEGREVRLEFHQFGESGRVFVDDEPIGIFDVSREADVALLARWLHAGNGDYARSFLRK